MTNFNKVIIKKHFLCFLSLQCYWPVFHEHVFLCTRDTFYVDVSMHSRLSFAGSYLLPMFCLHDRRGWFKLLFDRKVLLQCWQIWSSPFSLIRMDAMNSGVLFVIFTFKQLLSIVLKLIAILCAHKIYFEDSKIYQSHYR